MTTEHGAEPDDKNAGAHGYPGMPPLDVDKYRPYVDEFDITEERKVELLQTLWSILFTFVLNGFGVDAVKRRLPALAEFSSEDESDEVERNGNANEFNGAAAPGEDGPQ